MGNREVCFIVVFNHRYDKNIRKLKQIYSNRFKNVFYLVPHYDGDEENVIPVNIEPHFFHGFFAQAFENFFDNKYSHYIFIADDLILNKKINSKNILKELQLDEDSGYIKHLHLLSDVFLNWTPAKISLITIHRYFDTEYRDQFPDVKAALALFNKNNMEIKSSDLRPVIGTLQCILRASIHYSLGKFVKKIAKKIKVGRLWSIPYPLAMGYSDFIVVPSNSIKKFCHYCNIFASMKVFVEIAIPTALVLSCKKISTEAKTDWKGIEIWNQKEKIRIGEIYHYNLNFLYENFKENQLYLHPVKLSKWCV